MQNKHTSKLLFYNFHICLILRWVYLLKFKKGPSSKLYQSSFVGQTLSGSCQMFSITCFVPLVLVQSASLGSHHLAGSLGKSCEMVHTPTPTSTPTPTAPYIPSADNQDAGDFLSFADKRHHCASLPVFSDRPAIVRVVSGVRMLNQTKVQGLHSAAAVEDLRGAGDSIAGSQLKGASGASFTSVEQSVECTTAACVSHQPTEQESNSLESLSDCEEKERVVMETGCSADSEIDSDSLDANYAYPLVHEVTDLNISDCKMSYKESAPTPQPDQGSGSGTRKANLQAWLSHGPSLGRNEEESTQRQVVTGPALGGRTSCPPLQTYAHRKTSAAPWASETEPHAFKPVPHRPQATGISMFRQISTVSMATESEHQFLQSVQSTVSFPTPTLSQEVIVPVSGSTIDLIVLLQRTLGFGRSLCQAIFPAQCQAGGVGSLGDGAEPAEAAGLRSALESSQARTHLNIVKVCVCVRVCVFICACICACLYVKWSRVFNLTCIV